MGEFKKQIKRIQAGSGRGWWMALAGVALVWLALVGGPKAWAAPVADRLNQTVPQRTPTSQPTAVPTVTPVGPTNTPVPTNPPPTNTPPANATATPKPDSSAPTATPTVTSTATALSSPTAVPDFALLLQMETSPQFVMQGSELTIRLTVSNPGKVAAANVQVRDELPAGLVFVDATVTGGSSATEKNGGRTVLLLNWPTLAAGGQAEAVVRVTVAPATPDGAVIDNLAVAWADNAGAYTTGFSIGMPPALLPTFD